MYLPGNHKRGQWLRVDSARILKRLFFCERALIIAQAGWLPSIASFEVKTTLPRCVWEDSLIADQLRERIFELKFPSRMLEIGDDAPLIDVCEAAIDAPGPEAFVWSLARVFKPALRDVYLAFGEAADELSQGPIRRHIRIAAAEKAAQVEWLTEAAEAMFAEAPQRREEAETWVEALSAWLQAAGGISFDAPTPASPPALTGRRPFRQTDRPARDPRFHCTRYYWPDIIDSTFGYGEGVRMQLRSAISHVNEVWAVETAGAILHAFADELGWEYIRDTARWTYDEARHTRMGLQRLRAWGFEVSDIPLGSYLYESAGGQDPAMRLGMLHHFEAKNIGKKVQRRDAFETYQDRASQRDMDFDWADETMHAHYGKVWLQALAQKHPDRIPDIPALRARCEALVLREIEDATEAEKEDIHTLAEAIITKAERLLPA